MSNSNDWPEPGPELPLDEWVDQIADRFDAAWSENPPASIADFISGRAGQQRLALLRELVRIDLEYRWRAGEQPSLDDYLREFPELLGPDGSLDDQLVQHADRLRHEFAAEQQLDDDATLVPPTGQEKAVRISCPHCGNPIQLVLPLDDITTCQACGSTFRLDSPSDKTSRVADMPKVIGKFQLLKVLGRGAFGTVYLARDSELVRTVAVKVPRAGYFNSQEHKQRFLREAKSASQLQHPDIVHVHEIGHVGDMSFIVSEFIDGETLKAAPTTSKCCQRQAGVLR